MRRSCAPARRCSSLHAEMKNAQGLGEARDTISYGPMTCIICIVWALLNRSRNERKILESQGWHLQNFAKMGTPRTAQQRPPLKGRHHRPAPPKQLLFPDPIMMPSQAHCCKNRGRMMPSTCEAGSWTRSSWFTVSALPGLANYSKKSTLKVANHSCWGADPEAGASLASCGSSPPGSDLLR